MKAEKTNAVLVVVVTVLAIIAVSGNHSAAQQAADRAPAAHLNATGQERGKSMETTCADPPIVKRTNLTQEEKRNLLMRITTDLDSVKGELFLPLFLEKQDLPGDVNMTQDTRRHLAIDPGNQAFAKHCGYCSGLALWEGGFDQAILRLVDIRWVFPTEKEAQAYHAERLLANSEGQPKIPGAPAVGTDCRVFGGTLDIRGTPLTHYYYIFRVHNVVVKLYIAQGPNVNGTDKALTIEKVSELAKTCMHRIEAYNQAARMKPSGDP